MKKLFLFTLIAIISFLGVSQELLAQSSKTKVDNKAKTGKKSEEITDALTKIEHGSASTWSIQTGLEFEGGNLTHPFGDERPDIHGSNTTGLTALEVELGLVRKLDSKTSLGIGTGFSWDTPISSFSQNPVDFVKEIRLSTPSFSISRIGRVGEWQGFSSVALTVASTKREKRYNFLGGLNFQSVGVRRIGGKTSPWKFRYALDIDFRFYDSKTGNATEEIFECKSSKTDFAPCQIPFLFQLYPIVTYDISDRLFIRTVFGIRALRYIQFASNSALQSVPIAYQSLGVGIVASDSVYLYPNLQFDPTNIVLDNTNVAIQATINIF